MGMGNKNSQNSKVGRVIIRKREKPAPKKWKHKKGHKSHKKGHKSHKYGNGHGYGYGHGHGCKGQRNGCRKCNGYYPIPYPGAYFPGK